MSAYSSGGVDDRLVDTVRNLLIAYGNLHRHCRYLVRTVYYVILRCILSKLGKCRTYVYLDTLRHTLADADIVLAAHILLDVGCKVVTRNSQRTVRDDTSE